MTTTIEVFGDINCPFTHVGLRRVVARLDRTLDVDVWVRSWPLEWVDGQPLRADAVAAKIRALEDELGVDCFAGFRAAVWPSSTVPALNLAASAYSRDAEVGLRTSLKLRSELFEHSRDVSDPEVLAEVAASQGLEPPPVDPVPAVIADYEEGLRRDVRGSPEFWVGGDDFFCPSLDLGHDHQGTLTVDFDSGGLDRFLERVASVRARDRW